MKAQFEAVRQLKPETAEYRVVFPHGVAIRAEPWGAKIDQKMQGQVVKTNVRTVGGDTGDWVRLLERFGPAKSMEGWMLIDGTKLGLGKLLERVDRVKKSRIQRCATQLALTRPARIPPIAPRDAPRDAPQVQGCVRTVRVDTRP